MSIESNNIKISGEMQLSRHDLEQLMQEPSAKVRAALCRKICAGYNDKAYGERETDLALQILRLLLRDTSVRVRTAMSESLKDNPEVPHDIVLNLANDTELVAEAVLAESPVLTEEDLITIVQSTQSLRKLMAVAGRDSLSGALSDAVIRSGEYVAVKEVIDNPGAQIADNTFAWLMDEYYEDDSVMEALVYRGNLPYSVAEKLFHLVANHLRKELADNYRLGKQVADDLQDMAREVSMMRFMSPWMAQQDIQQLVQDMQREGRLTDSMVIRSLCVGDLRFFQTAIAKRAGLTVTNAKMLMLDPDGRGFDNCYEKAGMPEELRDAVWRLFSCALEETQLGQYYHEQFTQRIVERVISGGYDQTVNHMPSILAMLGESIQHVRTH